LALSTFAIWVAAVPTLQVAAWMSAVTPDRNLPIAVKAKNEPFSA
jgi:hypothetical protein